MVPHPDPFFQLLINQLLARPGLMAGLKANRLVITEIPEVEWPASHDHWDQIEQFAREVFQTAEPWPAQINAVIACHQVCLQTLRSHFDPKMLDRMTAMLRLNTHEEAIAFSELFLNFLIAKRPKVAA